MASSANHQQSGRSPLDLPSTGNMIDASVLGREGIHSAIEEMTEPRMLVIAGLA
jgi:hypothetical protein